MPDITELLHQWRDGDREAEDELFTIVLPELRRLARRLMQGERKGHSMQPSDLVDQIYIRLIGAKNQDWQNRAHFFCIAARAMRRQLIDHARARGHVNFVGLDGLSDLFPASRQDLNVAITVDRLLDRLAEQNPEWCRLVEFKYFLGLKDEETAEVLGMKIRTMQRMWLEARQWLFAQMEREKNVSNDG
jgi:RNA polymerase sigma factor (TIGR02999 family)